MVAMRPITARTSALRAEVINAIADLAIAARAGTLLKAYQREWAWVDKQNYVDAVDADEFNEAFHGIEREFDKLAEILAQGTGPDMTPTWEQEVTLAQGASMVTLTHNLGTTNLLVDLQARLTVPGHVAGVSTVAMLAAAPTTAVAPGADLWVNLGLGVVYAYGLSDDNTLILVRFSGNNIPHSNIFPGDLTLRVRLWKLGE
jgi:hypothetical protein